MSQTVSPFLEGIIQCLDHTLCEDNKKFTELSHDLRIYTGLHFLSFAGIATEVAQGGHDYLWEPSTTFLPVESRKQPGFAPLVIADFFLPDEVAELALEYSQAFADLLRESGPLLKFIRVGYENYALGLVDWTRRRSDGVLVWEG